MIPEHLDTAEDLEAAFVEWNEQIFRYIYARTGRKEIAEDITQETFLKAWNKRKTFHPKRASLRVWLFSIATNTMRDFFRKEKHRTVYELDESLASKDDVEKNVKRKTTVDFILQEMRHLSAKDQELLTLRYVHDLPLKDICEILEMRYSSAKVALHRAMSRLRKRCTPHSKTKA